MLRFFRVLRLTWFLRFEPRWVLMQQMELLIKAGRRCAYDLKHAVDSLPQDEYFKDVFEGRAEMWLNIFNPETGVKDYRSRLMVEIQKLELDLTIAKREIQTLKTKYNDKSPSILDDDMPI